jgi:hypothetical protein
MCTGPRTESSQTHTIGTAEEADQHGDLQGYAAGGGLAGDDARHEAQTTPQPGLYGYDPLAKLGIFALKNLPSIGAGGMKNLKPTTVGTDPLAALAIKTKPTGA